jgi:RimJ/RimL family protein N-acetyltransferase
MRFEPLEAKDKTGQAIVLRNAEESDAEDIIIYLKITTGETPFLIREPDEVKLTLEDEKHFINICINSERELMLIATINGKHIGNCSLMNIGTYKRHAHRCEVAIALYQEYCGRGIGKIMMNTILNMARNLGYEQAELEVVSGNERAISLYKNLGFEQYGVFPNNMKYENGQYADSYWMMKKL